ncbi:hypothetical protein [Corynebacterium aquilae]|uniref:hypothetical protein n=1 Tax=Corynebacterium aquilae TaxID=203263 RepID=UPI000950E013|nr:hypothetical protein [Corynebacterium aquilae]
MPSFLITYNRRSGVVSVREFADPIEAAVERVNRALESTDTDTEIVTVSSASLESVKQSHSRYFMREQAVS